MQTCNVAIPSRHARHLWLISRAHQDDNYDNNNSNNNNPFERGPPPLTHPVNKSPVVPLCRPTNQRTGPYAWFLVDSKWNKVVFPGVRRGIESMQDAHAGCRMLPTGPDGTTTTITSITGTDINANCGNATEAVEPKWNHAMSQPKQLERRGRRGYRNWYIPVPGDVMINLSDVMADH